MDTVTQILETPTNPLIIELPEEYLNQKLQVTVSPIENEKVIKSNYDFSDLVGKLQWKGDALAEQKKLRDEWD